LGHVIEPVALFGPEFVEESLDLEELLATLEADMELEMAEDVAIWHGPRVVLILHADGIRTYPRRAALMLTAFLIVVALAVLESVDPKCGLIRRLF
jgi:hypothetical protein